MARARLLHPEFARHEGLAELGHTHRLLFALLPTIADREGLLEDRPRRIKADLFPYDTDLGADVERGLDELARIGCIQRVEMYGRKVITIPGFLRWNKPHPREKQSELSKEPAINKKQGDPKASPGTTLGGKSPPVSVSVSVSDPVPVTGKETTLPAPKSAQAEARTSATREAYCAAYLARHGAAPAIRNKASNGMLANLVDLLGAEAAPKVAAFYVGHNWSLYVNAKHPLNLLVRDAAKLHTEWATDSPSTMVQAQQQERTDANLNGWGKHLSTAKGTG